MHDLSDERTKELLNAAPEPGEAIAELFQRARVKCEDSFFLSILDIEPILMPDSKVAKSRPFLNEARGWVADQMGHFLAYVSLIPDGASESDGDFIRYLQLLGYSQAWECLGIQRLVWELVRTASGREYDSKLLIGKNPATANVITSIKNEARSIGLVLARWLDATYHRLVRNAFAHSDFLIFNHAISTAPDISQQKETFYMRFETWDRLFGTVMEFVRTLYEQRREAEALLAKRSPYTFSLAEFQKPFTVYRDERNHWVFQH